jgi:Zn-dependent peptidase ImmA (M78 family)
VVWQITQAIEQRVDLPALALPDLHLAETAAPVEAAGRARELRDLWHLPDGPVGNVGRLVERHGGVVARVRGLTERVDAFSQWLDGRPFVILWRNKADTARSRFDAAHELGHLVMHPDPESGNKLLERQAHAFAAEFLMPADVIEHHLPRRPPRKTDLEALVESKKHWGVSIAALFYRSRELGLLSKESHRRSMIRLSELGYRTSEPGDLGELEMPALLRSALELTEKETGWGVGDLATELRLPTPLAREICGLDAEDRVAVDPLRFPDIREKGIDRSGRLSS